MDERKGEPATAYFRKWLLDKINILRPRAERVIRSKETHAPLLFVFEHSPDGKGRIAIAPVELDTLEAKERAFTIQRLIAQQPFVEGVIFLVESWVKSIDNPSKEQVLNKSIADDPDRKEAIMFNALMGRMQLLGICEIKRPDNTLGEPTLLDPMGDNQGASGRMIYDKPVEH